MKGYYIVLFNISNPGVHPATDGYGFLLTFAEYEDAVAYAQDSEYWEDYGIYKQQLKK